MLQLHAGPGLERLRPVPCLDAASRRCYRITCQSLPVPLTRREYPPAQFQSCDLSDWNPGLSLVFGVSQGDGAGCSSLLDIRHAALGV